MDFETTEIVMMSVVWIWCLIFKAEYHDTGICLSDPYHFLPSIPRYPEIKLLNQAC